MIRQDRTFSKLSSNAIPIYCELQMYFISKCILGVTCLKGWETFVHTISFNISKLVNYEYQLVETW